MGRLRNQKPEATLAAFRTVPAICLALGGFATLTTAAQAELASPQGQTATSRLQATGEIRLAQQAAPAAQPVLSEGSSGQTVSRLQATLTLLGFYQGPINGTYDDATVAAVSQFQSAAGLAADGIVGPATWSQLLPSPSEVTAVAATPTPVVSPGQPIAAPQPANPEPVSNEPPILRPESEGPAVAQLQRELQTLGYYEGDIDGGFGELTRAAVEAFQADNQLVVDAIVGPSTWDALTRALESIN